MTKINNIAKNTSYLTAALILQKVISFSYFTLLARYLGPENLGNYYFALSFTTIFAIFIDLGVSNVIIREIAKNQEKAGRLLGNILTLKIPLAILSALAAVILINIFDYDPLVKTLVYISCFSMVLDSFTLSFYSTIRGFHNLKYESISSVVFQLIVLVFGYGALLMGGGLIAAMLALVLASLYNFIYSFWVTVKKIKVNVRLAFDKTLIKQIALITWPFALYAIFQRLYTYFDTVLISYFAGNEQVGLYQIAFKIVFALQFLPLAFTASLYPALSSYWQNNREQLAISFERALNYLTIISLPIIVGIYLLADKIILLFKAGYDGAILPLQIAIIALFFIFVNYPIGSLLNACDRQLRNTINIGIVALASIVLNFIFIPRLQAVGASIVMLISNGLLFFLGVLATKKIMPYRFSRNFKILIKTLIASALMGGLLFFTKDKLSLLILIPVSGLVYFYFLYLLGGFKKEDVFSIFKSFKL
ncbi:MAG: flippase [Patescibacteria group bacterium]|jgi:O-antigen/teichoic acid export membrane protein|nr:flippase [bacterium]HQC50130.1 flippase [bacterium]